MEEKYRGLSKDFQKTLVFMDEIDEKLNKKIEDIYRKYNGVFYTDNLLRDVRGRVMSMIAPSIDYDDYTLDKALNDTLLERMNKCKMNMNQMSKNKIDENNKDKLWLREDIFKLSEMINLSDYYEYEYFWQDYIEDFSFRIDFLTRISCAMEYPFDKERLNNFLSKLCCNEFMENLIKEYNSKLKEKIYSKISEINKLGIKFKREDILYLIWKKIYAFGRGSKISAIRMIDNNTINKIFYEVFNELYLDKKIQINERIYKVYKYILNNPIDGEYEFNDKFKNDIVYAMNASREIYKNVIDDKNKIDYSLVSNATYGYINEQRNQRLREMKEKSIKKEKYEKSVGYKVKKVIKNPRVKIFILSTVMAGFMIFFVNSYNESKEIAIASFTPGIERSNIYTVNNSGYGVLVESAAVFYNNVMEKHGDSSLALVGIYESYIYVKQDRLSIMDKALMDLYQYCCNNPEYSDLFKEIMPYENFVQYVYARLVSLGCEEVSKYSEVVSKYSEIRKASGSAIIDLEENGLTELEDFMRLYRIEEQKVMNDLVNRELASVRKGLILNGGN